MNLEQRIAALETLTADLAGQTAHARRSARRWRLAALAAGLAMIGGIGAAAGNGRTRADVITAERLEIVNDNDDVVIELTYDDFGGIVAVHNSDGTRVASMEVIDTGGLITACNADGDVNAAMAVDSAGGIIRVMSTEDDEVFGVMDILGGNARVIVSDDRGNQETLEP
ncbi:MAG: hypothetical protein H6809_04475 [Phycisphaeraceae bacterium]|nr:hypothetical protein [Phycisphaeraceae bacterium]